MYQQIIELDDKNTNHVFDSVENLSLNKMSAELFSYSKKKNKELKKMKEIENFRRQFLADIAHELKTPVHVAQGFIETLIDGAIDDLNVRDRFLQKTSNALDNLELIIRDLINISHLETGEIKPDFSVINLTNLIWQIIPQFESKANSKGKFIHFECFTQDEILVEIDEFRMGQVFNNLIGNSINYSGNNQNIWIRIKDADKKYLIEIEDDGIGIPKEHHDKIFNRFYRVDKSRSKEQGGTGLGLSIVKHIIEVHHSEIKIVSESGKGAKFYFFLNKTH